MRKTTCKKLALHLNFILTQIKCSIFFQDPKLAELTEMGYLIALPDRDKHGRRVIYSKAGAFDATRFTTSDMMRAHIMTFETLLNDEENQVIIPIEISYTKVQDVCLYVFLAKDLLTT